MHKDKLLFSTLFLTMILCLVILPSHTASDNSSFYWVKPGVYASYCSNGRIGVTVLRDIRVSDKTVYVTIGGYLAEMCFKWSILDVHDNLALINFTITLNNIERESSELCFPYTLENPELSFMYPPIPGSGVSGAKINVTWIYYNMSSLTLSRNITVSLNNMRAYYNGKPIGTFFFIASPKVISENKPLTLYTIITDFKEWNLTYEVEEGELEKYVYNAIADLKLLQELGENASFKIGFTILSSSRLLRTETSNVRDPWLKRIYYEENKTLVNYVYDPGIPKVYYDTLSGILVAIALESPVSDYYEDGETFSSTFESDLLYNLFNITYIATSGEVESPKYIVDGFYRLEIKLVDTNIPLEKPVFGEVKGYSGEYSLFKVLLLSLFIVLALIIILFRRFR